MAASSVQLKEDVVGDDEEWIPEVDEVDNGKGVLCGAEEEIYDPHLGLAEEEVITDGSNYDVDVMVDPNDLPLESEVVEEEVMTDEYPPSNSFNLLDLHSRNISFDNNVQITICFSKRCLPQLAWNGYLFNAGPTDPCGVTSWLCVNSECGAIVTTAQDYNEMRMKKGHVSTCLPDEAQLRLRVAIYDLRLMAEFTEVDLRVLYENFAKELHELQDLIPSFEALERSLDAHRRNKTYRRRFEENGKIVKGSALYGNETYFGSTTSGNDNKYKHFPTTLCMECGDDIGVNIGGLITDSSPERLIAHLAEEHAIPVQITTFKFEKKSEFEIWLRELQRSAASRMRRLAMYDSGLYYLCALDDRIPRNRSTAHIHCPCFVKVHNFRNIAQRQNVEVVVDFNLEHHFHVLPDQVNGVPFGNALERLKPDAFIRELARRRRHTQEVIMRDPSLQRIKRARLSKRAGFLTDFHRPMYVEAAEAAVSSAPYVSSYVFSQSREEARKAASRAILNDWKGPVKLHQMLPKAGPLTGKVSFMTQRKNFVEYPTFNYVLQTEVQCELLKQRLQHCRSVQVARKYLDEMTDLVNRVFVDPQCAPAKSATRMEDKEEDVKMSREEIERTFKNNLRKRQFPADVHDEQGPSDGPHNEMVETEEGDVSGNTEHGRESNNSLESVDPVGLSPLSSPSRHPSRAVSRRQLAHIPPGPPTRHPILLPPASLATPTSSMATPTYSMTPPTSSVAPVSPATPTLTMVTRRAAARAATTPGE